MTASKAVPFYRNHLIRDAIGQALYDGMTLDPSIYLFGEGCHVKVHYDYPDIEKDFSDRLLTLPIAEDGSVNFAVGASLLGVKPVVNLITADFAFRAADSICNTAAKLNFVLPDTEPRRTIVIQAEFLLAGPTTGQRPEMLFARIPGLYIVVPSTPRDAYGLMRTALETPGVTLLFEDRMILDSEIATVEQPSVFSEERVPIPFGAVRHCTHPKAPTITVVTYGLMRQLVEGLIWEHDFLEEIELLDLRTLYPMPYHDIDLSVSRTGKLLIVEPDIRFGGIGAEIVAQLAEGGLSFELVRLGGPREIIPASREGQARMMPSREQILEAIRGLL